MQTKSFDFALKEQDEGAPGGSITAYASTFDREPDSYGDVVAPGAFADSIKAWEESGNPIPLLFGHRTDDPTMNIGAVTKAIEDERGLLIEADFDPDSETAQYCRKLVMEGRLCKLSFAFEVLDEGTVKLDDGTKANELRKLNIFEVSLVPIPANRHATVESVKSGARSSKADTAELEQAREHAAAIHSIITSVLGDEPAAVDDAEASKAEANVEEPDTANTEEQKAADPLLREIAITLNEKGAF